MIYENFPEDLAHGPGIVGNDQKEQWNRIIAKEWTFRNVNYVNLHIPTFNYFI